MKVTSTSPGAPRRPGTELELLYAPERSTFVPLADRDRFDYRKHATHTLQGHNQQLVHETAFNGDGLRAFADIAPRDLSKEEAQRVLDAPFEWRAFHIGHGAQRALVAVTDPRSLGELGAPPVYDTWSPQQLKDEARRCLRAAGVESIRVLDAEHLPGARLSEKRDFTALVLEHDFGPDHYHAIQTFAAHWRSVSPWFPPLFLHGVQRETNGAPVNLSVPILERCGSVREGKIEAHPEALADDEYTLLARWTKETHGLELPRHAASRALLNLLSTSHHGKSIDQIHGVLDLHEALGTISKFTNQFFRQLLARYGTADLGVMSVSIEAHLKLDAIPLLLFRQIFAPHAEVGIRTSPYSGSPIMRALAEINGIAVVTPTQPGLQVVKGMDDVPNLPRETDPPLVAECGGRIIKEWLKHYPRHEIIDALESGRVRLILHNTADFAALKAALGKDAGPQRYLNDTGMKRKEAELVGHRQILQAAQIVRRNWDEPIGRNPILVVGAGLIGGGVANAALSHGISPSNLLIVDPDPAVRAVWAERGCPVFASVDEVKSRRLERTLIINATSGPVLSAANIFLLAKDSILISMTSGGRGFDWSGQFPGLYLKEKSDRDWDTGYDYKAHRGRYSDVELLMHGRTTRIVARGYPPNLLEEEWTKRFELTTCLMAGSILSAMQKDATIGQPALPPDLDQSALELFEVCDQNVMPRFQGHDEASWRRLLDDFRAPPRVPTA